jgi:hypothetical protein
MTNPEKKEGIVKRITGRILDAFAIKPAKSPMPEVQEEAERAAQAITERLKTCRLVLVPDDARSMVGNGHHGEPE